MVIYNLVQYLRSNLPNEIIYANLRTKTNPSTEIPDRNALVKTTGGIETAWFQFQSNSIQVISRDITSIKAEQLAFYIHNLINNKFGLILPEVVIDGVTYPEIISAQISVNTIPQSVGFDEEGHAEYSANYRILKEY